MNNSKMILKCAWCDSIRMGSLWLPNPGMQLLLHLMPWKKITHGICNKCLAKHYSMTYHDAQDRVLHFK